MSRTMFVRAAEMVRRPGLFRAENDADACRSFAAVEWHDSEQATRIIHEYLLQQPIPSPGAAFLVRSPRRTASPPVSPSLARSHARLRSQPLRDDIHESSGPGIVSL